MDLSSTRRTRPGSLADQVYRYLRTAIVCGTLKPGQKLVELDIAAEMGTSQGTIREALHALERDGLVERRARRATYVSQVNQDEIYAFFAIRSTIETFAIQQTAARMTDEYAAILQSLVDDMHIAAAAGDLSTQLEYDMEFHRLICEWSGSRVLVNAWQPLYSQIQRFAMQTHGVYFTSLDELAATHQPIIEVLQQGDIDKAAACIQEHVMLIWSHIHKDNA